MADPGTLIPADNSSAKEASFKPINPKTSTIPSFPSLIDAEVVYSGPKPNHGEEAAETLQLEVV